MHSWRGTLVFAVIHTCRADQGSVVEVARGAHSDTWCSFSTCSDVPNTIYNVYPDAWPLLRGCNQSNATSPVHVNTANVSLWVADDYNVSRERLNHCLVHA